MAHRTTTSASASSSSAAYSASTHFQVFINHRGPDVKNTFAAHLYHRLSDHHGLQVFLDQPELQAGKEIDSQIKEAIQVASVHIAIFSEKYATSKWCLDELCLMVDSEKRGATILPVFYKVEPSELRWTGTDKDGPYAKALRQHEEKQRYDSRTIQSWREALYHVAGISGFELKAFNGNEAELLDKVVQRVLTKVPKPALYVAKYATGLGEKIKDFEKILKPALFQQEQQPVEAKVVGIAGLGGIGKTTLATEFFNCKRSHYAGSSFLADVREKASRSFLPSLQSKLIKDLKGINKEIGSWQEGIGILETCLSSCHALIILDDVDDADQLEAFLPIKGVLDPKSLILVTSRNKHVLRSAGIEKSSIYHLKGLNKQHSQELFCSHAFFKPYPRPGFENLVDRFVDGCDGLPLSLKVFGALLCEMDKSFWEEKLNELQRLPDKILATLKISYDSLNEEEQQIFLDIACFAIGEKRDKWVRIWGGSAGLQTLEDRCLVELTDNLLGIRNHTYSVQTMRMHDHLRDMGRDIAEEVSMPRRLWRSIEDVHDLFEEQSSSSVSALIISDFVSMSTSFKFFSINKLARYYVIILFLKNQQVIPQVRGIRMPSLSTFGMTEEKLLRSKSEIPLNKFSSQKAFKMRKLQLLESGGEFVEGILSRVRSPNLTWLRWKDCPCSSLPSWIPMDHLKVLEVEGWKLKNLWHCDSQAPLQLRELYVNAPLLEFPKSIGKLQYLEKIVVHYSNRFPETADLSTLPEEFFHVRSLKHLELAGCFAILPKEFGNLTNLQHLKLSGCDRLKRLPKSFGDLTNLQGIFLYGCKSLKKLPNSFGDLTNLQRITIKECKSLEVLPDSFGNLTNLQQIELFGCNRLKRLPNSLGDLTNLHRIMLHTCESLEVLPDSFGNLTNLQRIGLFGCNRVKRLPNSVGNLTNLRRITLHTCKSLEVLPNSIGNLTNLQYIDLGACESLEVLPDSFGNLTNLRQIELFGCNRLKRLPNSVGNLTNLHRISLNGCESLEVLPNSFGNLTNLQHIALHRCESLEVLPDSFGNLTNLQVFHISGCKRLNKLPDSFTYLTNLQHLELFGCDKLKRLPKSLGYLTNLRSMKLYKCKSLKKFPDSFGSLTKLQYIDLIGCHSLKTLPDSFGHLKNLEHIHVQDCSSLNALPNDLFGNLTNLVRIRLSGCESLEKLPDSWGNLTKLRFMHLSGCKSLKKLPNSLGELTDLERIDLSGCRSLKKLPISLGELTNLENIDLLGTNLKEFTNAHAVSLRNLKYLSLGSPLLKELPPSLGCLSSLETLGFYGCQELKRLPDSVGLLTQLTKLEISKCGIHHLPGLMEMNNLQTLRVLACPLRELPFKEESAPRRKRKRRAKDKGLTGLKELELYCTEISEVSFPEDVCINLQRLYIRCCNDLVKVGSLPATLDHLILKGCGALRKIEGLFGLAELDIRGCYNIQVEELPHFENLKRLLTPADTDNHQDEEDLEEEMAASQEGVLPIKFRQRQQLRLLWLSQHS